MTEDDKMMVKYATLVHNYCVNTGCDNCKLKSSSHDCSLMDASYLKKHEPIEDSEVNMILKYATILFKDCCDREHCYDCPFDAGSCATSDFPRNWQPNRFKKDSEDE